MISSMAANFTIETTIAAPPEVVWACLTDDELIGQWDPGRISQPDAGQPIVNQSGRVVRARRFEIQVVTPGAVLREGFTARALSGEIETHIQPAAGGTLITVHATMARRGLFRVLLAPMAKGAKDSLEGSVDSLCLRAEAFAGGRRDMYRAAPAGDQPSKLHAKLAKLLAQTDQAAAAGWLAAAPEMRNAVLASVSTGNPCPDRYGARLAQAVALVMKRRSRFTLVTSGIFVLIFAFCIVMEVQLVDPDLPWLAGYSVLLWWNLSIGLLGGIIGGRTFDAAFAASEEWLAHVDPVEHLIWMSRSSDPAQRNFAIQQLGAAPMLGPLNLRAEAALARAAVEPDAQWNGAAQALAARRARVLAAAA